MENRIGVEMRTWANREERFEKLFPGSLKNNKPFLEEKLNYLYRVQAKFSGVANDDERLTLKILMQQRQQLERQLYPGRLRRALNGLIRAFVQGHKLQKDTERLALNQQHLFHAVAKAGLSEIIPALKQGLKANAESYSLPLSYYVNSKERMDLKMDFSRNAAGEDKMDVLQCALKEEGKSEIVKHTFTLNPMENFDINQAYNMLKGRPAFITSGNADEPGRSVWRQLDFNDRDAAGNYKVKEFPPRFEFDLEGKLQKLPVKVRSPETIDQLKAGNRVEVTGQVNGKDLKFYLEANPLQNSITVLDENYKKVDIQRLMERATAAKEKQAESRVIKLDPPKLKIHRSHTKRIN